MTSPQDPQHFLRGIRLAARAVVLVLLLLGGLTGTGIYMLYFHKPSTVATTQLEQKEAEASNPAVAHVEDRAATTDEETGLILDAGWQLVKANCTGCHAAALVTQNRASREGWEGMIRWMQRTQKLWDLGENEKAILDYLAKNYAPEQKGRRENLKNIEWYELPGRGDNGR